MWVRILGSVLTIVALTACQKAISQAQSQTQPLSSLAGTEWGPVDNAHDQFVAFKSGGDVIGSGGCNNFFGSFEEKGRLVTFGPLASTRKACPEPIMSAEQNFLALLADVRAAEATRKELILFGENNIVLTTLRRRDWD